MLIAAADTHSHHLSMYTWSNECICKSHKLENLKIKQSRKECVKKEEKEIEPKHTERERENEKEKEGEGKEM